MTKTLIEELRSNAAGHQLDVDLGVMTRAADAIESQAATIARYETTAENYELLQAKVDERAREVERLTRIIDGAQTVTMALMEELAALKAQPSGVVINDEQIVDAMRKDLDKGDGGYLCDTGPEEVAAAGRALLAWVARLNSSPVSAGESCDCGGSPHTGQCLYEHFLSYSSLADHPMLRYAYFHGAGFSGEAEQHASAPNHGEKVRDGWQLVPFELSDAMLHAGVKALINGDECSMECLSYSLLEDYEREVAAIYCAMLAAAPSAAPAPGECVAVPDECPVKMEQDLDAVALCGCRIVHSNKNGNILVQCDQHSRAILAQQGKAVGDE